MPGLHPAWVPHADQHVPHASGLHTDAAVPLPHGWDRGVRTGGQGSTLQLSGGGSAICVVKGACLWPWQPLMGLLSWCPIFISSDCTSFEDQAPVDEIYGCLIFKWGAVTWLHDRLPEWYPQQWLLGDIHYYWKYQHVSMIIRWFNLLYTELFHIEIKVIFFHFSMHVEQVMS